MHTAQAHESLRILLAAHHELTSTITERTNQLRALLLEGDSDDRATARGRLGDAVLADLSQRSETPQATSDQRDRHLEIRRLATLVFHRRTELATNRARLTVIVHDLAPDLTTRRRIGPVRAAELILSGASTRGPAGIREKPAAPRDAPRLEG